MGRTVSGNSIQSLSTSVVPVGSYADVCVDGDAYKIVGSLLSRADFPAFSADFNLPDYEGEWIATQKTVASDGYTKLAYGAGVLVSAAPGVPGYLRYSVNNGETFTNAYSTNYIGDCVTYGNGLFVSAGGATVPACATSPDGINWTPRTIPTVSAGAYCDMVYGAALFVAVAGSYNATTHSEYATSPDGINWTARNLPSSRNWVCVAYGAGVFVALSTTNSSIGAYSSDGINWTEIALPLAGNWEEVKFADGIFMAVGGGLGKPATDKYMTSPDGITWTVRSFPSALAYGAVAYNVARGFWIVLGSSTTAYVSIDGINWTPKTVPSGGHDDAIEIADGLIYVCDGNGSATTALKVDYDPPDDTKFVVPGDAGKFVRVK